MIIKGLPELELAERYNYVREDGLVFLIVHATCAHTEDGKLIVTLGEGRGKMVVPLKQNVEIKTQRFIPNRQDPELWIDGKKYCHYDEYWMCGTTADPYTLEAIIMDMFNEIKPHVDMSGFFEFDVPNGASVLKAVILSKAINDEVFINEALDRNMVSIAEVVASSYSDYVDLCSDFLRNQASGDTDEIDTDE